MNAQTISLIPFCKYQGLKEGYYYITSSEEMVGPIWINHYNDAGIAIFTDGEKMYNASGNRCDIAMTKFDLVDEIDWVRFIDTNWICEDDSVVRVVDCYLNRNFLKQSIEIIFKLFDYNTGSKLEITVSNFFNRFVPVVERTIIDIGLNKSIIQQEAININDLSDILHP